MNTRNASKRLDTLERAIRERRNRRLGYEERSRGSCSPR